MAASLSLDPAEQQSAVISRIPECTVIIIIMRIYIETTRGLTSGPVGLYIVIHTKPVNRRRTTIRKLLAMFIFTCKRSMMTKKTRKNIYSTSRPNRYKFRRLVGWLVTSRDVVKYRAVFNVRMHTESQLNYIQLWTHRCLG
jgi:hypothetical protein